MNRVLSVVMFILVAVIFQVEGSCPNIVSRSSWGAKHGKGTTRLRSTPWFVVVHHSETPQCSSESKCKARVQNIQDFHIKQRGWSDIGYNFLIGGDGQIYEGRGFGIQGAHVPKYNSKSLGICLIGNYQNENPPAVQLEALKKLIECAVDTDKLTSDYKLIGHRQGKATNCPGDKLYAEVQRMPHWTNNLV